MQITLNDVRRFWSRRVRNRVLRFAVFPLLFRARPSGVALEKLGTKYGGWWTPVDQIDEDWVCYFAGVGGDISFDLAIAERFGCNIWAFDPTPKSVALIAETPHLPATFHFVPIGLSDQSAQLRFYLPSNHEEHSASVKNLQRTEHFFTAQVEPVYRLMKMLGHSRIDFLKLDIEGAEHETIARMLSDGIKPRFIAVEFDQPEPLSWAWRTVKRLRRDGYLLLKRDGFDFLFGRTD